jgi:5-formyltetrahydrofolate cyclo-ligase
MNAEKEIVRKRLQAWRNNLDNDAVSENTSLITEGLMRVYDWNQVKTVFTYLANPKQHEINTWPFLQYLWSNFPEIRTYAPVMQDDAISLHRLEQSSVLNTSSFGIPEPLDGEQLTEPPEVCIVPVTAFNDRGFRLGYGKGHYDRYLAKYPGIITIGIAYDTTEVDFPIEPHDIPLVFIVTEKRILKINR